MKLKQKILVKEGQSVKAIIDLEGKVLSSDKKVISLIRSKMKLDLIVPSEDKGILKSSLQKVTNDQQLFILLHNELFAEGYTVELEEGV